MGCEDELDVLLNERPSPGDLSSISVRNMSHNTSLGSIHPDCQASLYYPILCLDNKPSPRDPSHAYSCFTNSHSKSTFLFPPPGGKKSTSTPRPPFTCIHPLTAPYIPIVPKYSSPYQPIPKTGTPATDTRPEPNTSSEHHATALRPPLQQHHLHSSEAQSPTSFQARPQTGPSRRCVCTHRTRSVYPRPSHGRTRSVRRRPGTRLALEARQRIQRRIVVAMCRALRRCRSRLRRRRSYARRGRGEPSFFCFCLVSGM